MTGSLVPEMRNSSTFREYRNGTMRFIAFTASPLIPHFGPIRGILSTAIERKDPVRRGSLRALYRFREHGSR